MLPFAPEDLGRSDPADGFVHKTGIKALMTTVMAWQHIFLQLSASCTLCMVGGQNVQSILPPVNNLSPLQRSAHSDPTDKPHLPRQQALAAKSVLN